MTLPSERIQPINLAEAYANGLQLRNAMMQQQQNQFQFERARRADQRQEEFLAKMQAGDLAGAQAADPMAFAAWQQKQAEAQKMGLEMSKTGQGIANDRAKRTQEEAQAMANTLAQNPRMAAYYRNRFDILQKNGLIDPIDVPGADTARTLLEPGMTGPEALPTRGEVRSAQTMAGVDPYKGLDGDLATFLRLNPQYEMGTPETAAAYTAWLRANKKSGASNVNVGGKVLPSATVSDLSDLETAMGSVDQLFADFAKTVPNKGAGAQVGARVTAMVPNTTEAQYQNNADVAAQSIGTILEGGKLTETDLQRYKRMLPQPGDSIETAKHKRDNMKAQLRRKLEDRRKNLEGSGYRVNQGRPQTFRNSETDATMDTLLKGGQ